MRDLTNRYDGKHRKRIEALLKRIDRTYTQLIEEIAYIAVRVQLTDDLFRFSDYPKIADVADAAFVRYARNLSDIITTGIASEWLLANMKMDAVQKAALERIRDGLKPDLYPTEISKIGKAHNDEALKAFQRRKVGKFTISERVWDIGRQAKGNIELALDVALKDGISAQELARAIKSNLNNPDALFRRVRDKHGNLKLSKAGKAYKPGQGVYRSAHKNALRLAANEINTAYRESEQVRLEQNNDVVGVEIHLSPSHRQYDICDELKGKYQKDFHWSCWHIGCKCFRTSILKTDEELINEINSGRNEPPTKSVNYVKGTPPQFKKWVSENADKMKNWKTKPEFIENNARFLK